MNITSMAKTLFASVKIASPSKNSENVEKNHQKDQNDIYKSNQPINFQPHFLKSPHIFTLNKHYLYIIHTIKINIEKFFSNV